MQVALQISKKHKKKDSSPHLLWFVFVTNHTDADDLSSDVDCGNVDDNIDQGSLRMVEWIVFDDDKISFGFESQVLAADQRSRSNTT